MTDPDVPRLRAQLADARAAAQAAYRDSTRLIRLLTVLGTPASPGTLVERTLSVLSEAFGADVVCVAELVDGRLLVTASCGLPEDDPAFQRGWPLGPAATAAMRDALTVERASATGDDRPPPLPQAAACSAAWIPLSTTPVPTDDLLVLYRSSGEPFNSSDLHILRSMAYRMSSAVEARQRGAAIERLAEAGPSLAREFDQQSLLDGAADLLRRLTGVGSAWVASVRRGVADLTAYVGLDEEERLAWPRSVDDIPQWTSLAEGRPVVVPSIEDSGRGRLTLCAPVRQNEQTVALLGARTARPQLVGKTSVEVAMILANYLSVALRNSDLYQALAASERELRRRATHDDLTGLANRTLARQRIDEALSASGTGSVGVLFLDLDAFKAVNDRLGHEAGDELVQQVAVRLRRAARDTDLLARFGGDEFVIVLAEVTSLTVLADLGRHIHHVLGDPFLVRGERITVTASVGAVLGRRGRTNASVLLRDSDAAMYAAKAKGPGRTEVFDDEASHRSVDRLDLRSELPHALARGQLSVAYQPIVELATKRIRGYEALVRWTHPGRGPVPPDVFIPMAEETGAIVPIGAWVLAEACERLAEWQRLAPDEHLTVAVNVSAVQLVQPAPDLLGIINAAGVDPADVWLEITEHTYPTEDLTEPVTALRKGGVHFALDDFGMSYSSMSYLQRFPVECIKIDKSFVAPMHGSETERGIVKAVLAVAESLSLGVIAEGIETAAQLDALSSLGCRYGQGYLLYRPMPAAECTSALLAQGG